jgi:hypothetical protein
MIHRHMKREIRVVTRGKHICYQGTKTELMKCNLSKALLQIFCPCITSRGVALKASHITALHPEFVCVLMRSM